jgi:site-specific DNA-methyltransferase (adenine-specific)
MVPYYDHAGITIYHGDCRDVLPTLGMADLILTDPPYGVSSSGAVHDRGKGKGKRSFDFFAGDSNWEAMNTLVAIAIGEMLCHLYDHGSAYIWCGHRQFGDVVEQIELVGMKSRPFVWVKKCPPPSPPNAGYSAGVELCVYGYGPGRTWNGGAIGPSNAVVADSYRHGQPGKVDHPTQKPLSLISGQIEMSTLQGHTVLDPFMGSGTTLRAAKDLGRKAIGIEIEEKL